jgi:HSP20 family protein
MARTDYSPMRELEEMLERFGRSSQTEGRSHETVTAADWTPAVDVSETDEEYLIKVELSEIKKNDIEISANAGALVIQGERKPVKEEGRRYHRIERPYGRFARSFALPDDVEEDGIRAEHKDGVLYLHLTKHKEPPPKSVKIKVQ